MRSDPVSAWRVRILISLAVAGAVTLMLGVLLMAIGEAMRFATKHGSGGRLISVGVTIAIVGMVFGMGVLTLFVLGRLVKGKWRAARNGRARDPELAWDGAWAWNGPRPAQRDRQAPGQRRPGQQAGQQQAGQQQAGQRPGTPPNGPRPQNGQRPQNGPRPADAQGNGRQGREDPRGSDASRDGNGQHHGRPHPSPFHRDQVLQPTSVYSPRGLLGDPRNEGDPRDVRDPGLLRDPEAAPRPPQYGPGEAGGWAAPPGAPYGNGTPYGNDAAYMNDAAYGNAYGNGAAYGNEAGSWRDSGYRPGGAVPPRSGVQPGAVYPPEEDYPEEDYYAPQPPAGTGRQDRFAPPGAAQGYPPRPQHRPGWDGLLGTGPQEAPGFAGPSGPSGPSRQGAPGRPPGYPAPPDSRPAEPRPMPPEPRPMAAEPRPLPPESLQADPWQAPPAYVDPELVTPPSAHAERPGPDDLPSYVESDSPIAYGITDEEPADAGPFAGPVNEPVRGFFEPPPGQSKADDLPPPAAGSVPDESLPDTPQGDQWSTDQWSPSEWSPSEWSPAEEPAPPTEPAPEPVAQQEPDSSTERLDEIKDFYLTAEAIGEENVDKHFNELLDRQRELISQYFKESGAVKGPRPAETTDTPTTGITGTMSADPITAENPPAP